MNGHDRESDTSGSGIVRQVDDLEVQHCDCLWRVLQPDHGGSPGISQEFPGFVVRRRGTVLAAAGCCREPDQTLSVTIPLLTPAADWREQFELATALFSEMIPYARQLKLRTIHCLVPSDATACSALSGQVKAAALLQHCGLVWMATIVRQTRLLAEAEFATSGPKNFHGTPLTSSRTQPEVVLARDKTSGSVHELLETVLRDSLDLPASIRPSAEQLLAMWMQRGAEVMVFSREERPIAIAALLGQVNQDEASLEYIGVHPEHRLAGIGRGILRLAEQAVMESAAARGRTGACFLNAFADAANRPAMRLYAACGYAEAERLQLYCLPLFAEPGVACVRDDCRTQFPSTG